MSKKYSFFLPILIFGMPFIASAASCPNLSRNVSFGSRGNDIVLVQTFLMSVGDLSSGNGTGYFGRLTEAAAKKFQCREMQICSGSPSVNGYGSVGPRTRATMTRLCTQPVQSTTTPARSGGGSGGSGGGAIIVPSNPTPAPTCEHAAPPQGCYWQIGTTCANDRLVCSPIATACTFNNQTVAHGSSVTAYQSSSVATGSQCLSQARTCTDGVLSGSYQYAACSVASPASCTFNNQTIAHGASTTTYQTATVPYGNQCVSQIRTCTNGVLSGSYTHLGCTVETAPIITRTSQKMSVNANNVYSPEVVIQDGLRYLYFGGWVNQGQTHDNIYRAQCGNLGDNCTGIQTVIDSFSRGLEHFNDPTIVKMPGNYYIMYGTGVLAGQDGFVLPNNKIYYSTSYTNDGVNWSAPALVIGNAWLPSATIGPDGGVELFANSTENGVVLRYRLGGSGIGNQGGEQVIFANGLNYLNVDVEFRPGTNLYEMFGERFDTKHIDYLTSSDGIHFNLIKPDVVTDQSAGVPFIRTPGQDANTASWLYYAGTSDPSAMQNKIYFQAWQ